jgi:hypothetical protein
MRVTVPKVSKRAAKAVRRVRVRPAASGWETCAGMWKDDPAVDEFLKAVAKLRKNRNRDGSP